MNFLKMLLGAVICLVLIQFIPYGKNHRNPPITGEPKWDSEKTKELFARACRDCHSNETVWPWYSDYAPASWLVEFDVTLGRKKFNVSEWGREGKNEGDEAAAAVRDGKMPPFIYLPAHPEAKLSAEEKSDLARGLAATFGDKEAKK